MSEFDWQAAQLFLASGFDFPAHDVRAARIRFRLRNLIPVHIPHGVGKRAPTFETGHFAGQDFFRRPARGNRLRFPCTGIWEPYGLSASTSQGRTNHQSTSRSKVPPGTDYAQPGPEKTEFPSIAEENLLTPLILRRGQFERRLGRGAPQLTMELYFCKYRNMKRRENSLEEVTKYADMFSAMGTEPRLRIMQLLLSAHPEGLVVGEIHEELGIPNSTLSHHLDKLKNEGLVRVSRESTFLRYTAHCEALRELLQFLYAECCTRNKALKSQEILQVCR